MNIRYYPVVDSAENIPSSPPKTELFSLLLLIRQNDNTVDFIPCLKCDFASYKKSRNLKNFTNQEKYYCDFIVRFINEDFSDDNIENILSSTISDSSISSEITTSAFSNSLSISKPSSKFEKNLQRNLETMNSSCILYQIYFKIEINSFYSCLSRSSRDEALNFAL